ncbi:MAG: hypothetical protein PF541_15720, partial [Prolixibacteraceae bacterium]|nr:hypothetical protein [Prolixibacteraceae bacterium]
NNNYVFNEFLKVWVENGVIGVLLFVCVAIVLLAHRGSLRKHSVSQRKNNSASLCVSSEQLSGTHILKASILSVLIFGCFGYPSEILPIKMVFVMFASIVATDKKQMQLFQFPTQKTAFAGKAVWHITLAIVLLIILYPTNKYLTQQYKAYKTWKDASDIYNMGAYPECLEDFELAYPQLKTNGVFLVQYGKALQMADKNENSIAILNEAKQHLNNTILYTCLGNNYKALGRNTEAEQAYLYAWNMAPAKFFPLYLLAKLYDETGQTEKAVAIAKKVMGKEVKIESTAIEEIKEEMKKIIEKSKAEPLNESKIHTYNNLHPIYKGTKEEAYRSVVLTCGFKLQKW